MKPIDGQDTSTNSGSEALAVELARSDLGQLINEYKNVVIFIIVLFIAGAISYVGWKSYKNAQHETERTELMIFKKDILVLAKEQKKSLTEVFNAYQDLLIKIKSGSALMEITPDILLLIREQPNDQNDWGKLFQSAQKLCEKNDFCFLHFGLVLTNFYEEKGKVDLAFDTAALLVGNPYAVEDKLYFDLVRLAKAANKSDKKTFYLDLLKQNHSSSNFKVLAEKL